MVTVEAFKAMPHSNQTEASIIDALRSSGALTVSLVAIEADEVIGHAAFSPVEIATGVTGWYGLGPVSVRPERQGQGVGQALIHDGVRKLLSLGAAGCVVLGDPRYYGRFGFESDPALHYGGAPSPYFQRLIFHGPPPRGEVHYHSSFDA
jgi:putative acetyltransferase